MNRPTGEQRQSQMRLGIYAKTFEYPTVEGVLDAVQTHGLNLVEFDMACAGLPTLPDGIDDATIQRIRTAAVQRRIELVSISGTFNMAHPDPDHRRAGLSRLGTVVRAAQALDIGMISLCTGTRDLDNMWRRHPANNEPAAWTDLRAALVEAVRLAEAHDRVLAFEPEVNNVVDSAQNARRMLDEIGSPHLKVVIDGANIFHEGDLAQMQEKLREAVDLLADDIAMAHAKDLDHDGDAGHLAAGHGVLDYRTYMDMLKQIGFAGPLLLHGLDEAQVDGCVQYVIPIASSKTMNSQLRILENTELFMVLEWANGIRRFLGY